MDWTSPLLIASPVPRSGTTLLQRLLCSATNCIIYGESCANDLMIFSNLLLTKQYYLQSGANQRHAQLQSVLDGQVNDWIADLMPPANVYEQGYRESFFSILRTLAQFADQKGRPVWGVKMAGWSAQNLVQIVGLLPSIKLIYIIRSLTDCVRSAKGAGLIQTLQEIEQFCRMWGQYQQFIAQHFPKEKLLWLSFDDLTSQPASTIQQLEAFTTAQSIKPETLEHRINTVFDANAPLDERNGYERPMALTEEEKQLITTFDYR